MVELPPEEAANPEVIGLGEAFANYYHNRAEAANRDLRELFRVGWRSLVIGLTVLIGCLVGSQVVTKTVDNEVVRRVLAESLIIVGWVANWRPIEIYLYAWWPIRRRIILLRRIAVAPLEVRVVPDMPVASPPASIRR